MGLAPGLLPGRTTLEAGRKAFRKAGWTNVPAQPGLDAAGILGAAADGKVDVLVLLGADPAVDFPDHDLASRALAGARTVIAVDTFLTESSRQADVVLAASGWAETPGSTTNTEGRVSTLHQQVTPPGTARADWMVAAELAFRLNADLGIESVEGAINEIGSVAPAHAGLTASLLSSAVTTNGLLFPLDPAVLAAADGTAVTIGGANPATDDAGMSSTGVTTASGPSAEAGISDTPETLAATDAPPDDVPASAPAPADRPETLAWTRPTRYDPPLHDAYSLRLVATRKLYDRGTLVTKSPSLVGLAPGTELRVNPADLERLGLTDGARVKASSARSSLTVEARADAAVPQGTAHLHLNQPDSPDPAAFIDATAAVTDIRVETV